MKRVLRGCRATATALAVFGVASSAHAATLAWQFNHDETSAFVGVTDSADQSGGEGDYPFYMACASTGDQTTVVSQIDAKALGQSIAKGDVPSFTFVLDGEKQEDSGGEVSDIRFDEMNGVWQYLVNSADYDLLLTASSVRITGVGVDLELPQKDMADSLQKFKDACDAMLDGDEGETDGGDAPAN